MKDTLGPLFFKEKQTRLLLALNNNDKEWHLSDLAKATDVTYIHTSKFISRCESIGLVASEKHGRIKRLYLTDKGKAMAIDLSNIINKINQITPVEQLEQKATVKE